MEVYIRGRQRKHCSDLGEGKGREVTKTWKLGRGKKLLPQKELVWFSVLLQRAPQS